MDERAGELTRKSIHVAFGGLALALRWLEPWQAAAGAFAAALFNLLALHRLTRGALLRAGERAGGFSWGVAGYPCAVLALIVVFRERLELAAAVWGLVAFGDGMAAITGVVVGGPRLAWNRRKTVVGSLAFIAWGTAGSALLLRWTQLAALDGDPGGRIGASFLATGVADERWLLGGCLVAAIAAAGVESLDSGVDDNLTVPLVGGAVLSVMSVVDPGRWPEIVRLAAERLPLGFPLLAAAAGAAFSLRIVTVGGAIAGLGLAAILLAALGWGSLTIFALVVVIAAIATRLGRARKEGAGLAEGSAGRRGAAQALANTSAAAIFAILAAVTPSDPVFRIALTASLATALADTVATEIGQAYARRAWALVPPKPVPLGTPGAVSSVGTLAAAAAAATIAATGVVCDMTPLAASAAVAAGAWLAAMAESLVGGLWRSARPADHGLLNFANTLCGAGAAVALYQLGR
ncbi:MAG TPA: DUF92 domain-containing protein [Candidatus Polarisedimenticolaceae bacterium]|nr:DUF92 domain-containing protein [Candidatus Polarisedimenticolaceae bacterium]